MKKLKRRDRIAREVRDVAEGGNQLHFPFQEADQPTHSNSSEIVVPANDMTTKERLRKLRAECGDWNAILNNLGGNCGVPRRQVELSILRLVDAGFVQIEPQPNGPTAFVLIIPDGIPPKVLAHVEE